MVEKLPRILLSRLSLFVLLLFGLVLIPFMAVEDITRQFSLNTLAIQTNGAALFLLVVAGLSLDIFLPLPSTVIASTGASLLGIGWGFVAVWSGLTCGCIFGYEFGASAGHATLMKMVNKNQLEKLDWMQRNFGLNALVICRVIPVLAEVSVLMAGSTKLPRYKFYSSCLAANVFVAGLYVGVVNILMDIFCVYWG